MQNNVAKGVAKVPTLPVDVDVVAAQPRGTLRWKVGPHPGGQAHRQVPRVAADPERRLGAAPSIAQGACSSRPADSNFALAEVHPYLNLEDEKVEGDRVRKRTLPITPILVFPSGKTRSSTMTVKTTASNGSSILLPSPAATRVIGRSAEWAPLLNCTLDGFVVGLFAWCLMGR